MIAGLLRTIGWRTLANLALLFVLFGSLVWGLTSVVKGLERGFISIIILICISLVMILARLQLSNGRAALLISLTGGIGSIYYFAGLSSPLGIMLRSLGTIPETLLSTHTWPDLVPLVHAWEQFFAQLGNLLNRTGNWLLAILQGQHGFDIVAVSFTWGLILWLITAWAAWGVFHLRRPLPAIAPAGIFLSGALNYANGSAIILLPFLGAALLLMALNRYEAEEHYWQQNHIDYAEDIRLDLATVVPLLVLGLIILATFAPPLSLRHLSRLIQKIAEPYQSPTENLAESLGIDQAPASTDGLELLRSPGLPQLHLISAGAELSQQLIMIIQTGDLPPLANLEMLPHTPEQYYWRSLTYDIYTGHGWATSTTETIQYKADQPALVDLPSEGSSIRLVEQNVQFPQSNPGILYAAGLLVSVDVEYVVAWRMPLEDTPDMFGVTTPAQQYQATSLWVTPSVEQLRNAPASYPIWIRERYLALPDNLPQRVYNLAMDLTRGHSTPYDQAAAIETYLRSYPYTLDVPAPPPNQDVADYFLFELRQGYCDYYATAMVVLGRAAGLPTRLVSGYATGTYDPPNARYIVTADNAHSWVEIYFSGIGWVEFEPTGGLPAIARRTDPTDPSLSITEPKPVQRFSIFRLIKSITWLYWILGIGSTVIAILIVHEMVYSWRLHHVSSRQLLVYTLRNLIKQGDRLAIDRQSGDTPAEYATRFSTFLNSLVSRKYVNTIISPASGQIEYLIMLYNQGVYSPYPILPAQHKQAARYMLQLRWRLTITRLLHRGKLPS